MAQIVVGTLRVDLVANTATFTPGLDDATKKAKKAAKDIESEFDNVDLHEARGSVALLSEMIGIHLPRHVRSFLAELPGVSTVMAHAFTAVAILALADALYKAYEKLQEYEEAARKAKDETDELNFKLHAEAESLTASTMKIEDQIRALRGIPAQNKLAIALIESTKAADDLQRSLQKDIDTATKLIADQAHGAWVGLIRGQQSTNEQAQIYIKTLNDIRAMQQGYREDLKKFEDDHAAILARGTAAEKAKAAADLNTFKEGWVEKIRVAAAAATKMEADAVAAAKDAGNRVGPNGPREDQSRIDQMNKIDPDRDKKRVAALADLIALSEQFRSEVFGIVEDEEKGLENQKAKLKLAQTEQLVIHDITNEIKKRSAIIAADDPDARAREAMEAQRQLGSVFTQNASAITRSRIEAARMTKEWDAIADKERLAKDTAAEYAIQLSLARGELTKHQAAQQMLVLLTKERSDALTDNAKKMAAAAEETKRLSEDTMGGLIGTDDQKAAYAAAAELYRHYKDEELKITKEYNGKIQDEEKKLTDTFKKQLNDWMKNSLDILPKLKAEFFKDLDSISGLLAKNLLEGKADWKGFAAQAIESLVTIGIQALMAATVIRALNALLHTKQDDPDAKLAKQKDMNFQAAMSDAAASAANTFALYSATAILPVAAGMATLAYGIGSTYAALAKFEQGGVIPNTGIAMVHKGEGVFSAPVTNALLNVARSNMNSAPAAQLKRLQMNYSPQFKVWDKADVASALEEHKDVVRGLVRRELARL